MTLALAVVIVPAGFSPGPALGNLSAAAVELNNYRDDPKATFSFQSDQIRILSCSLKILPRFVMSGRSGIESFPHAG